MKSLKEWCMENQALEILEFYELAENLLPSDKIGFSSAKKVNWKCPNCQSTWLMNPNHMTRKKGKRKCMICTHEKPSESYNAAVLYPELLNYWDSSKNVDSLYEYMPKSNSSNYWKCEYGHEWKLSIKEQTNNVERYRRNGGKLCKYCNKEKVSSHYNLEVLFPNISAEWNYFLNKDKTPDKMFPYSNEKVWWKCSFNSVHIWQDRISNRTKLLRECPICSKQFRISYPARVLFFYLKKFAPDCVCEEPFGRFTLDILLPKEKIAIEHDGHYYHSSSASIERAKRKDNLLKEKGYRVFHIQDSKDLKDGIYYKNDIILYPYSERWLFLDNIVTYLIDFIFRKTIVSNHRKDHWEIKQQYYHERKKRSLAVKYPKLAEEWSPNNIYKPDEVSCGTGIYKPLWICPICKKEYSATISNRVNRHSGCPSCRKHI